MGNLTIHVLTLFPDFFKSPLSESILARAIKKGLISVQIHNLRTFGLGERKTVDDNPYGGSAGMVLRVDVLAKAAESVSSKERGGKPYVVLLDPKGKRYDQGRAEKLSKKKEVLLVCGHYEGVDQRFADYFCDEVVSVGDFVLTGGETAALVLIDSIVRLQPGVLGKKESLQSESFSLTKTEGKNSRIFDFPTYTRPESFQGKKVPPILLSGNHAKIKQWRANKARQLTLKFRKDLVQG
ncbi:MAG: tRNA (guanosine(37)-N1)-methyltransferase TrmD [Candidatus Woykebacteria bacterium]